MISNNFQFEDYAQKFYSYNNEERFYQVLTKHRQLQNLLLSHSSLKELQTESKNFKNMITYSFLSSAVAVGVFNKTVNFGSGIMPTLIKLGLGLCILTVPTIYVAYKMRIKLMQTKTRVFAQNRPFFRKYELTGDVLQSNRPIELVE